MAKAMTEPRSRCPSCGYRRQPGPRSRCPECGNVRKPIEPPTTAPILLLLATMGGALALSFVPPILCAAFAWLGFLGGMRGVWEFYLLASFGILGCYVLTPGVAGIALIRAPDTMLELIWLRYDGSIGPWSGRRAHVLCWLAVWIPVAAGGLVFVIVNPVFPPLPPSP